MLFTLVQEDRPRVQGYFTQSNLGTLQGVTLPTSYVDAMLTTPPPPADLAQLERTGQDAHWHVPSLPHSSFRKALQHVQFHVPKKASDPSFVDQWIRFRPGGSQFTPFPHEAIGYVVDMFPLIIEQYPQIQEDEVARKQVRWYPTVALNLDVKKRLPVEGVKWLFVRARAGKIENGRMDLQVVVLDESRELVAVSSHVTLVMSAARNTAGRKRPGKTEGSNKL